MLRGALVAALAAAVAATAAVTARSPKSPETIEWRRSQAVGLPYAGRLVGGVRLPAETAHYFTWDPIKKRSPSRAWRRYGTDWVVRAVLRVVAAYAIAHPDAPRIGIGDLSRPNGGRFGRLHASHQNGLDVDVYYPRRDRRERPPKRVSQVDRRLAQDLVDRFVAAGATRVFVGPHLRLRGPRKIVEPLWNHDNHLHARFSRATSTRQRIGRSSRGRPLWLRILGDPQAERSVLVVGCIHGTECAGIDVTRRLRARRLPPRSALWVVDDVNPDGRALGVRQNGRGVDLNRNFPSEWRPRDRRWDPQYSGPRPLSEPESGVIARLVRHVRPDVSIWYHQPQGIVRAWGGSRVVARRYARLAGMPFRAIRWPRGTVPNWQNQDLRQRSFVVELPPGRLSAAAAARHAAAVTALARRASTR